MSYAVGLSTCGKQLDEALFAAYRRAGIECMEISTDIAGYAALDLAAVKGWAAQYGVTLWSLHLPFFPFDQIDPSFLDAEKRRKTAAYFSELIHRGAAVGISRFVIHASGEPVGDGERAERLKCAAETLAVLAETAARDGARVCVEDLPRTCLGHSSADILELLRADDRLRVCFDTNHLLLEDNLAFIKAVGAKIVTTHISDYDFIDEKHWMPGEGGVDWQALAAALQEVGYTGAWLYEIGFRAPASKPRSRELNCEDFVRNAKEIFQQVPITLIE